MGKNVLKAGLWYVISTIMVKAITVLTTPFFTRIMTTEQYGEVSTFSSWHSILIVICTMSLQYSIGRAKLDFSDKLDEYIGSMQLLSLMVSAIIVGLGVVWITPISEFIGLSQDSVVLLLLYLLFSPSISFTQTGYRYRYQYKQNIAIAWYTAVVTVLLSFSLMFLLDYDKATLRMIGIVAPTVILSLAFLVRSVVKKHLVYNKDYWKYGLKLSTPLILHTLSMHILSQSDRIFITKICGAKDTGIYSLAYTYAALISLIINAISEAWLPWFHESYYANKFEEIKKNTRDIVILGGYIGLACVAFAPEAVYILGGDKYSESVNCVLPIVLGVVCTFVYTHYVNIELHLKKSGYVSIGSITAAILNIILNAIFIPKYGFIAAAYTTFISYIFLSVMHYFITRIILKVKLYDSVLMFGVMLVVCVVSGLISCTYENNAIRYGLIIIGFISFILYFKDYVIRYKKSIKIK